MRNIHTLLKQTLGALPLMVALSVQAAPDYGVSEGNEELLIQGLESLASQQFDDALTQFHELTQKRPDFRLAQLVYADLLASQANPLGEAGGDQSARKKQIQGLIDEARARLTYKETRRQGLIPKSLVQMSDNQKYLIMIDTDLSRLFLFENKDGTPTLVKDYYASYGRGGTEKRKQGDLKTPLGVYFVTRRYQDRNLPERYGSGALPINYPNRWDDRHGYTGNGIWVHGSPVDTYSRPPKASEGCISLTNPDFIELDKLVDIKNTPVLIGKSVEWVTVDDWKQHKGQLATFIDQWRQDWESRDHNRYIRHYSKTYKAEPKPEPKPTVVAEVKKPEPVKPAVAPKVKDLSVKPDAAKPTAPELVREAVAHVNQWAEHWRNQNVNGYVNSYTANYRPGGLSHSAWVAQRKQRLSNPTFIKVTLANVKTTLVNDNTAKVVFSQGYQSNTYQDQTRKELTLTRVNGQWRISDERSL